MRRLELRLRQVANLAARGEFSSIASKLRKLFWSETYSVLMRRDLSLDFEHPTVLVAFSIRPLEPDDAAMLFDVRSRADQEERRKLENRIKCGLNRCYVAALEDGRITYIQWLCTSDDNDAMRDVSTAAQPIIEPGTVLLEGAYTPPRFRRLPVMPAAMARIAEEGRRLGARWAIVCIEHHNASMIRAAEYAGFSRWRLITCRRRLFRPFISYSEAPAEPAIRDR